MSISLDLSNLMAMEFSNPFAVAWYIISNGGWIILVILGILGLYFFRLERARALYRKGLSYILLAIDIPKENPQSMKAVEQIFAQLYAAETSINLWQKWWLGKVQDTISLEIVSIGGYIQYLIRVEEKHRDLIEAAVFAQYPDAEITEVEDYVNRVPSKYPNDAYDLWGTELILARSSAYPIRTYVNFEHTLTEQFADPMVSILESLSRIHPAEDVWIQILITPASDEWKDEGERVVKKLIGEKSASKPFFGGALDLPARVARGLGESFISPGQETELLGGIAGSSTEDENKTKNLMQHLSPGSRNVVIAIEEKIAKIGFHTKVRLVYAAPKSIFNKARGAEPTNGAILQFNTQNLNAFKSHKKIKVKAEYFMVKRREDRRKRKLINAYKLRADWLGAGKGPVLNIEELASIFHFPVTEVKAPLVKTTEGKKTEPPSSLPTEEIGRPSQVSEPVASARPSFEPSFETSDETPAAPDNLPVE